MAESAIYGSTALNRAAQWLQHGLQAAAGGLQHLAEHRA
jgi:hypothetical protein